MTPAHASASAASWGLEVWDTEQREARCRRFTTSQRRADAWERIPRIDFSDSGHGLVFHAVPGMRRTKATPEFAPYAYREHEDAQAEREKLPEGERHPTIQGCEKAIQRVKGRVWMNSGYRQEGEIMVCPCGQRFVRAIEESEGAWWEPVE